MKCSRCKKMGWDLGVERFKLVGGVYAHLCVACANLHQEVFDELEPYQRLQGLEMEREILVRQGVPEGQLIPVETMRILQDLRQARRELREANRNWLAEIPEPKPRKNNPPDNVAAREGATGGPSKS